LISVPFALYDAFSETAFGGSQAGVVSDAASFDKKARQQIASELGTPVTAFVTAHSEQVVSVRFHSPVTEYNMCGHGTVCLMTRLVEQGVLSWADKDNFDVDLCLPSSTARVHLLRRADKRPEVFLDIVPPKLTQPAFDRKLLESLLGLRAQDFHLGRPLETASGDFIHLIVPLRDLAAMARITPDFQAITRFCNQHGLQTIAVFCTEVDATVSDVHMRDFCPAVGVTESAGAGTTNAALATYLIRHLILQAVEENGKIIVQAEQGIELGRPGTIRTIATMSEGFIARLQVGGVATKIIDGELLLPD
jgi:trans-2,3-dihydro-3-hydroxyanthranilate isomerase